MNPIVKSIFAWLSETVLASVMELSLVTLINIWNCIVDHFDLFLPKINIAKLCKVTNCKDASTSYEPFHTPITDDLILLDFGSTSDENENWNQSVRVGVEAAENDCTDFTEFKKEAKNNRPLKLPIEKGEHKEFKKNKYVTEDFTRSDESYYYDLKNFGVQEIARLKDKFVVQKIPFAHVDSNDVKSGMITERSCDSLGFVSPLKYPDSRNIPFKYTGYSKNQTNMYVVKEKCDPNTLMNGSGIQKNVDSVLDIRKINTKEERRLSTEEISLADWGQTLKHQSETKRDNKKPIKKQHTLNPLTISPVRSFERKMSDTVAENTEKNSEDLSTKEFLSLGKVSLNNWQERNQTVKQKSIEENVFRSQSNIPLAPCKKDALSCKQNLVGNSNVVNENNNRINDFDDYKSKYVSLDDTSNDMLFNSEIDNINEVHIQPSQMHNSTRFIDEMKDTALVHDSVMKEKTSQNSYLESTRAKHKIFNTAVMCDKIHNAVNWNLNFKSREAPDTHFKQHDLSSYNRQSENPKIANDLNLRNKFESWMVVQNENAILEVNENENVSQKGHNILGSDSCLENRNGEFQCAVLDPSSPLTENHEEEDPGEAYFTFKTTSVLQGEQVGETQSDGAAICTPNIQTESIEGTKKVQFKPEVETFIYEPEYSTMETFQGPEDFRIEPPVNTRSGSLSRSFPIRNCCDSMLLKDNSREDWVNYDHKLINIIRDHPRIPEVISEDYMKDITDVSDKELKILARLKRDRKIFRKKNCPYVRSDEKMTSITQHFQSLKLDPKPLFEKLKKKVFGK